MATYKDFKEVDLWRKADVLNGKAYKIAINKNARIDRYLSEQLKSSSISIMSNIAEGFEREGNKELIRFLYIAKGSAGELRSLIHVAGREGFITSDKCLELKEGSKSISRMLAGFIRYLKNSGMKGSKYKPV